MRLTLCVVTLLSLSLSTPAAASVIDFTTLSAGSSASITIDGVTITGSNVSIVQGRGLGSSDALLDGSMDRELQYTFGSSHGVTLSADQGLQISVDGEISAFTILPYFTVLSGPSVSPDFWTAYRPNREGLTSVIDYPLVSAGTPMTFRFNDLGFGAPLPHTIDTLGVFADFGYDPILSQYSAPGVPFVARFGFSVLSVEYTANHVPEASTALLLGVGIMALGRRLKSRGSAR
jgi:hypothetical protein